MPLDIADDEVLIRAVTRYDLNDKGKLRPALFRDDRRDEISVSRRKWFAPWLAKAYAKAFIQRTDLERPNPYVGLAFITALTVREHEATVKDSRDEYLGHAHISYRGRVVQPEGEPLPPAISSLIERRATAIKNAATYVQDPRPKSALWKGGH